MTTTQSMNHSLIEFLENSDISLKIFDMGRRIQLINRQQWIDFEQGKAPYPVPYLQHAWFAFLLSDKLGKAEPLVWFLKFPLNEAGLLNIEARDEFLMQIIKSAGDKMSLTLDAKLDDAMKETPYAFKPEHERLACIHAKIGKLLEQNPSSYYQDAKDYFHGPDANYDHWQHLGLQGIADLCVRLEQDQNAKHISRAIPHLPLEAFEALCFGLENETLGNGPANAIAARIDEFTRLEASATYIASALRGLSHAKDEELRLRVLTQVLAGDYGQELEVLAAISARCWEDLKQPALMAAFMEKLALNASGQDCFNRVLGDLAMIPGIGAHILAQLRNPERSEALSCAIGAFLKQA